jgi:hypothetical protein
MTFNRPKSRFAPQKSGPSREGLRTFGCLPARAISAAAMAYIAFRQHRGGHTGGPNWPAFLAFAACCFEPAPVTRAN